MSSFISPERSYADLTMMVRPDMRKYQLLDMLIEFKYVGLAEAGLSGEQVKQMSREELKKLERVQQKLAESKSKLEGYRRTLEAQYGEVLRLHTYSVVAIGFDRLVWVADPV